MGMTPGGGGGGYGGLELGLGGGIWLAIVRGGGGPEIGIVQEIRA